MKFFYNDFDIDRKIKNFKNALKNDEHMLNTISKDMNILKKALPEAKKLERCYDILKMPDIYRSGVAREIERTLDKDEEMVKHYKENIIDHKKILEELEEEKRKSIKNK